MTNLGDLRAHSIFGGNKGDRRPMTSKMSTSMVNTNGQNVDNEGKFSRKLSDIEFALKQLRFWIRSNHLNAEDAFLEMTVNAFGRSKDRKVKVNFE